VKPANKREDRKDRRLRRNQSGKRKVVVVIRERGGKTLPGVFRNEGDALHFIRQRVAPQTTLYADEAASWNALAARFTLHRINHEEAYSLLDELQTHTNNAEGFFPDAQGRDRPPSSCRRSLPATLRARSGVARRSQARGERRAS
jgi:hypothetical protein